MKSSRLHLIPQSSLTTVTIIIFLELLEVFFVAHDPTQADGQGHDIGTQYLSAIFYLDEGQKNVAELMIKKLE